MGLLNKFRPNEKKNLKEEVFEHLTDFLNTKRNLGIYPEDYGIDSYIYLGSDNTIILKLISEIKIGLEKYEKRVQDIDIQPISNESSFHLSFIIKCKIEKKSYAFQLSFHPQRKMFNLETA